MAYTASDVAEKLEIDRKTASAFLDFLVEIKLAEIRGERVGVGRPQRVFVVGENVTSRLKRFLDENGFGS